jgi:HSP20 family protein
MRWARRRGWLVFDRAGLSRRRRAFAPAVDVVYSPGEPARVLVSAELAGVAPADIELELVGRQLILAGRRERHAAAGDVYHQVEIERGPFRRVVELGVDVDAERARARYEDGILVVELPIAGSRARPQTVAIQGVRRR